MSENGSQQSKSALVIVGLVVGIVALATSLIPFVNNMSFVLGLVGLVVAIVGLVGVMRGKHSGKGLAIASTVINVLALVFVLASQSVYSSALDGAVIHADGGTTSSSSEGATSSSASQTANSPSDNSDKYSIENEHLSKDTYSAEIDGTFTNTSGKELSYVGLTYNLYDASGNQIGNAYANTSNLADGSSWKFEAYCAADSDDIATYKLADVTAY